MCKIPNPEHTYKIGYGSRFTPYIQHHSSDGNVASPVRLHPPIGMTLGESSWWPCVARYLASQTEQCTSSPALAKVHTPSQTFIEGFIMNDFLGTIPHSLGQLVMVEKAANYSLLLLLAINAIIHSDVLNVRVWQILMWHLLLVSTFVHGISPWFRSNTNGHHFAKEALSARSGWLFRGSQYKAVVITYLVPSTV